MYLAVTVALRILRTRSNRSKESHVAFAVGILVTPRRDNLDATRIVNSAGLSISLLPSGAIFAIEHAEASRRIMMNQTLASPIANGMGRLYLRTGGPEPATLPVIGPEARLRVGQAGRPLCLGGRTERRRASRHPLAASALERMAMAGGNRQPARQRAPLRRRLDPRSWSRRSRVPDEQRGLCQSVSRSSYRAASEHELRADEPTKSIARRDISVDRAWMSQERRGLRNRFPPADGARLS